MTNSNYGGYLSTIDVDRKNRPPLYRGKDGQEYLLRRDLDQVLRGQQVIADTIVALNELTRQQVIERYGKSRWEYDCTGGDFKGWLAGAYKAIEDAKSEFISPGAPMDIPLSLEDANERNLNGGCLLFIPKNIQ